MLTFFQLQARPLRVALTAVSFLTIAGAALAQVPDALDPSLVEFGGSMTAAARLCGDASDAKAQESRKTQKKMALEGGMSAAAFDQGFKKGQSKTETRFAAMSTAEKKKSCAELHDFGKKAGQAAAPKK